MLAIKEFNQLSFERQCSLIGFKGKLLVKKEFGIHEVYLLAVEDFYVEIWFNGITNRIHGINAFETIKGLDMYVDEIDLSELDLSLKG